MPAFFLTFLACALATLGGREAVSTARLSARVGPGGGLLAAIWVSSIVSSGLAAWLGRALIPVLPSNAKFVFVAMALVMAAGELFLARPRPAPREPTLSAGATLLVLFASQVTDAARFLVLALAVGLGSPALAGAGGALATGIVLTVARESAGNWETRLPLAPLRAAAAGLLLLAGLVVLISALGLIG
ncbi:conserved hypothetical protein [Altererythrobacter sp. B11]|uniref:hypothetical protein n=1 Tax=Altererythrobacter sp. B11 TaxID=2060312 RepID=UPI000DC7335A|nr:hypothetical protein [Altererythrobacter sp. B11]BBC74368.1 conserved hypothetical protein [Altererythrobacter sp. B11]